MAARKGGLGKGFEALMQSNTMDDELGEKATLSINDIEPNRGQPRKTFSEESLSELADSIKEHGVLQPLLVRPNARRQLPSCRRRASLPARQGLRGFMSFPLLFAR